MRRASRRSWLAALLATVSGIALALVDSGPGFDATGLTVVGLVVAAFLAVVVAGTSRLAVAVRLGILVGAWIPILEFGAGAGAASLAAIVFAVAGSVAAFATLRALGITPAR
jgi:hypothetical protein